MTAMNRTVQLRRYELVPGQSDAFTRWWRQVLVPLRVSQGFRIEFGYLIHSSGEFLWAVSVEGDRVEFGRIEAAYIESPERARVFENLPERVKEKHLSFVDDTIFDAKER